MSMENIAGARKPAKREDEHTVAGEHRMMRRADREVTNPEQIAAIVAACDIVEVAYADAEGLTIVPLNFGFDYDEATGKLTLWFHSAPRGRKLDAIRAHGGGSDPGRRGADAVCVAYRPASAEAEVRLSGDRDARYSGLHRPFQL